MKKTEVKYAEPADYIPKEIRKKFGLGEYNDEFQDVGADGTDRIAY